MVGGVAANLKICRAPFLFQATDNNCCDSVATRAVSRRSRLKSLRDKRWRRPLSQRKAKRKGGPAFEPEKASGRGAPAPGTRHGGGVSGFANNICRGRPHLERRKAICCDSVAMRAVSRRSRLKSLRDKRWRRLEPEKASGRGAPPLSQRRRAGGSPAPGTRHGGGVSGLPTIFCRGAPHHFSSRKAICCDSVAMRAVSRCCQLKTLRDKRWAPAFELQKVSRRTAPPPLPRHSMVGGVAANLKICRAPFPVSGDRQHCCDSVATRAVSRRSRLKSLRDKRWRRLEPEKASRRGPRLSQRRRAEGGPPRPWDAAWWGGLAVCQTNICRGAFPIYSVGKQYVATALRCARFHAAAN